MKNLDHKTLGNGVRRGRTRTSLVAAHEPLLPQTKPFPCINCWKFWFWRVWSPIHQRWVKTKYFIHVCITCEVGGKWALILLSGRETYFPTTYQVNIYPATRRLLLGEITGFESLYQQLKVVDAHLDPFWIINNNWRVKISHFFKIFYCLPQISFCFFFLMRWFYKVVNLSCNTQQ